MSAAKEVIRDSITHEPLSATWVAVGNSSSVTLYSRYRASDKLEQNQILECDTGRAHLRDLDSDMPGRSFDSHAKGRHAMEPKENTKQHTQAAFARELVDVFEAAYQRHEFGKLIIILPPKLLGLVREHLTKSLSSSATLTFAKDYSALSQVELEQRLLDIA